MENTPKKELSSLHTPDGGTEKDTMIESNPELSSVEEGQIEVKPDASAEIDKEKSLNHNDGNISENHTPDVNNNQKVPEDVIGSEQSDSSDEMNEESSPGSEIGKDTSDQLSNNDDQNSDNNDSEIEDTKASVEKDNSSQSPVSTEVDSTTSEAEIDLDLKQKEVQEKKNDDGEIQSEEDELSKQESSSEEEKVSVSSIESEIPAKEEGISGSLTESEKPEKKEVNNPDEKIEDSASSVPGKVVVQESVDKGADKDSKKVETDSNTDKETIIDETHDFSAYTAEQIVELVKKLARYDDMVRAEKILRKVKGKMAELQEEERSKAMKQFIEEGGNEQEFSYKASELFERYDANTKLIYDRRHTYLKELEKKKEENLAKAEVLLERLREFLDSSESTSSFKVFKEIQGEWKNLGSLPGTHYRSLWANYNALVNRFYDTRSIYFELKELDRRKNLEYKVQLCEKAEALESVEDLKEAIIQLNELHHEYKHTGPVPLAEQEPLWQRFKAASDKIYERRKEYNAVLKKELKKNLSEKLEIAEKVHAFAEFNSERIKDWNTKTREILDLQKKWEAAGGLPREKAREINKKFWSSFKSYFNRKNDFFRKLEGQRTENLKLKEELVAQANEMKDSTDWEETAKKFKNLQSKWKEIGPVPEKVRNEVYAKFKASCDYFFNQKRDQSQAGGKEYEANLEKKKTIIKEIKKLGKEEKNIDKLKDLQEKFYEVGYVPRSEVSSIKTEFNDTLNDFLDKVEDIDESEKDAILLENKVEKIKHSPNADKKLYQKEQSLRKQINKIENDVSIWKNNIEFFANTKNAEKLKEEFRKKIEDASQELEHLKQELRVYASA